MRSISSLLPVDNNRPGILKEKPSKIISGRLFNIKKRLLLFFRGFVDFIELGA